jgi:hypothetical protein
MGMSYRTPAYPAQVKPYFVKTLLHYVYLIAHLKYHLTGFAAPKIGPLAKRL